MSARRIRWSAAILVVFFAWLLVEAGLWLTFRVLPSNVAFADPARWTIPLESIREQNPQYDAALGWKPRETTPAGDRPHPVAGDATMAAFGDSFTFCDEVGDAETWEVRLATRLRADVLNYGVGGYGIDQAVLRYEAYARSAPPRTVVLAFISENINRNVNVYRKFYYPKTQATFTKPRFVLGPDGLELLANPVRDIAERDRLADPRFVARLGTRDYWFDHRHLPTLEFPYTRVLFDRMFWRQLLPGGRVNPSDLDAAPDFTLWTDPAARDLTLAIFERFVAAATLHGDAPVILHLPVDGEIRARRARGQVPIAVEVLRAACGARNWRCLFPVLDAEALFPDADVLFSRGGHFNAAGNDRIAQFLAASLRSH